jgi:hypothetical protein
MKGTIVGTRRKKDNWFRNYQEISGVLDGKRKLSERLGFFRPEDFKGRTVLDVGCNIGQMCL